LRPWGYSVWEQLQVRSEHFWLTAKKWLDREFKKSGVQNAAFPLFVSKHALEQEKSHIEGFAAEVR
jgi:prolyl-tRNA synthetase